MIVPAATHKSGSRSLWTLARAQHGVVARRQLVGLGFSAEAIRHRLAKGRLHRIRRGVYAVGRPQLTRRGQWMAAVLGCGPRAVLSHQSAAALWGVQADPRRMIDVSVPADTSRSSPGVVVHRRRGLTPRDVTRRDGIPLTDIVRTLMDLAATQPRDQLERSVNEADRLDLIDPERLRRALEGRAGQHGITVLRELLDRHTFRLTDSDLERQLLAIVRRAGLPAPQTGRALNGFRVDFFWSELGLVIETDGLRYHRTAAQQARDRRRDQAHAAAGLTCLRFTHDQVAHRPDYVTETLVAVAFRLRGRAA